MSKKKSKVRVSALPDDKGFILDPNRWPCWPWLPLKRGDHSLENKNLGLLFHGSLETKEFTKGFTIYHTNLFGLPRSKEEWAKVPTTHYDTVDLLLADGWVVD